MKEQIFQSAEGPCWCGEEQAKAFDDDYVRCRQCGTLRVRQMPDVSELRVGADESGLYGRDYWFEHQRRGGLPDLEERRRSDVPGRCLRWLNTLLAHRAPPARVLEIGCSHGGFVALMQAAGYDAEGLELSPWVVDFARRGFDVTVHLGPVEEQAWAPGSFDVIVMMDVLEHLPRPLETVERCASLLADNGVLLMQTPESPATVEKSELEERSNRFVEMLLQQEHLFLFTRDSMATLCRRAGLAANRFRPALFPYDMFLAASAEPKALESSAGDSNLVWWLRALLDLHEAESGLRAAFSAADDDRQQRARQIIELEAAYRQADEDRKSRAQQVIELEASYQEADRDRIERAQQIATLESIYAEANDDRVQRADQIVKLETALREADEDRQQRLGQVEQVSELLAASEQKVAQLEAREQELLVRLDECEGLKQAGNMELRRRLEALERELVSAEELRASAASEIDQLVEGRQQLSRELAEQAAALEQIRESSQRGHSRANLTIEGLAGLAGQMASARQASEQRAAAWEENYRQLREVENDHRQSRIYRALVAVGRWRAHDGRLEAVLEQTAQVPAVAAEIVHEWHLPVTEERTVKGPLLIDLTALLPGGVNGGVKLVALALARLLPKLEPARDFILLTSAACHDELAALEVPPRVRRHLVRLDHAQDFSELVDQEQPVVHFCPTTVPPFTDARLPLVCLVPDLQDRVYPQFFSAAERAMRDANVRRAVRESQYLVAISAFVRQTLIESAAAAPEQVATIPLNLTSRLGKVSRDEIETVLGGLGVAPESYLLYPANFWPHKNHAMLLTAFALLHSRGQHSIKLVLTGSEDPDPEPMKQAALRMGLSDHVVFAGYVSDSELRALYAGCRALIFPSLYEGFGMPVLEAMSFSRPVLASDVTALPEVARNAAIYFDPRRPDSIVKAIETLLDDEALRLRLIANGLSRVKELGSGERMAKTYWQLLKKAVARGPRQGLFGVSADGWSRPSWGVVWSNSRAREAIPRQLELVISSPPVPVPTRIELRSGSQTRHLECFGRQTVKMRFVLPPGRGLLAVRVENPWVPAELGLNEDTRRLGCRIDACVWTESGIARDLRTLEKVES